MKKMGRREGRFPGAPNRVLREGKRATKRVSTSSLSSTTTSNSAMEVARGVERGIRAFNNLVGEEENEVKKDPRSSGVTSIVLLQNPAESEVAASIGGLHVRPHADLWRLVFDALLFTRSFRNECSDKGNTS